MAHKVIGVLFLVVVILHMLVTLPLIKQRPLGMYILGFIMLFCALTEFVLFLYRKKIKGSWLSIHRVIALCILICLVGHVTLGITSLNRYNKIIQEIQIEEVDLAKVEDGTYIGEFDAGYIYAKVEITISENKIISVDILEHRTEHGKPAEILVEDMVKQQKVLVDAVSGATNSSKVIEKAVSNALENDIN